MYTHIRMYVCACIVETPLLCEVGDVFTSTGHNMDFKCKQNILIGGFSIAATNSFALAQEVMNQNLLDSSAVEIQAVS